MLRGSTPRIRALAVGVTAAVVLAIGAAPVRAGADHAERRFTVMTQNLYLGANLQPLFEVTSIPDIITAAAQVYAHVLQVDFPARAEAVARNIIAHDVDLVGLQEVALWQTASIATHVFEPTVDYLTLLLDALEEQGVPYEAVVTNVNFGAALPISSTTLASLTMRDVILVRAGLKTSEVKLSNAEAHNFEAMFVVSVAGGFIHVPRGWSSVDVKFRGKSYRFANGHLEAFDADVRAAQAQELAAALSASPLPVILTGDMNSQPGDTTGAYGILQGVGFADAWSVAMGSDPGWTSGQPDDLDCTQPSTIDHRIDYVLYRGSPYLQAVPGTGEVVGEETADCTTGTTPPLWPSDHAGVVVTLHIAEP